jgi:hypothetical protein
MQTLAWPDTNSGSDAEYLRFPPGWRPGGTAEAAVPTWIVNATDPQSERELQGELNQTRGLGFKNRIEG